MEKYKGLIFDFNGVLLLDQHLHDQVFKKIAQHITGHIPTDQEFREHFHGRTNELVFEYLFGRKLDAEDVKKRSVDKELEYQRVAKEEGSSYALADGATELLAELKAKKIPYTIGTSSPTMNIPFFNEMLGLDTWFDLERIVCDDGTLRGKPAPDIYLRAAKVLELNPGDCVVIEDARSGIAAAQSAGIGYIIAIGPKETHEQLSALSGVSEVIETLKDVDVVKLFK